MVGIMITDHLDLPGPPVRGSGRLREGDITLERSCGPSERPMRSLRRVIVSGDVIDERCSTDDVDRRVGAGTARGEVC